MNNIFANFNVVQVLRVGLSGLLFLLSFLAYRLIDREQRRPTTPRKGILRTIYVFMAVNLLGAVVVAVAGYFAPPPPATDGLNAETYAVDYTSYFIDLTKWTETTHGPVVVTRTDFVRKVSSKPDDYIIPFFTTGTNIEFKPIAFSHEPRFVPKNDPDRKGLHYDYVLPIGREPANHSETVTTEFKFPSGFSNPQKEWWEASVAFPTKTINVVMNFPTDKPAKNVSVSEIEGIKAKQGISDNPPTSADGGRILRWTGMTHKANSRIHFDWDW